MVRKHMRIAVWKITLVTAVALATFAACSNGDDSADKAVQPIDDILATGVQITDITGSQATLQVDTSIPVACSVVYGPDTTYGQQATDTDMAGGGHTNHHPLMQNLEPNTEYHYRFQGSGPDGTLYASDDMTFTTNDASASNQSAQGFGRNVASASEGAMVADASSEFSADFAANNALDGDPATEWSSNGDGDDAFIEVQLAESFDLTSVGIWTRTMGATAQINQFQVVTDDGTTLGPFEVPSASGMITFPVSVTAQTLRFEVVSSSGGNTGLVELGAFVEE